MSHEQSKEGEGVCGQNSLLYWLYKYHKTTNLTGDFILQASRTPGSRATKALQEINAHNIISTGQGAVSMTWRTVGHSHFQLRQIILVYSELFGWCILGKGQFAC